MSRLQGCPISESVKRLCADLIFSFQRYKGVVPNQKLAHDIKKSAEEHFAFLVRRRSKGVSEKQRRKVVTIIDCAARSFK